MVVWTNSQMDDPRLIFKDRRKNFWGCFHLMAPVGSAARG